MRSTGDPDDPTDSETQELCWCCCGNEYLAADKAFRMGCDEPGGCPELRAVTNDIFGSPDVAAGHA